MNFENSSADKDFRCIASITMPRQIDKFTPSRTEKRVVSF